MVTLFKKIQSIQRVVVVALVITLPILVFIQVLLRYVFQAPLLGIEELLLFPTIWLYMLGGANASMDKEHITCGILTIYIKKERTRNYFDLATAILSVGIAIAMTYWAFQYFMYSLKMWKDSTLLNIPMFFGESAIFIGLLLMSLYAVLDLVTIVNKQFYSKLRSEKQHANISSH